MAINVEAVQDIVDPNTGTTIVPKGSPGTVASATTPSDPRYTVDFIVDGNTVSTIVTDDDIAWEDGDLGKVRAFYEGQTKTISAIGQVEPVLDFERSLGPTDLTFRMKFTDGTSIVMKPNRNTGRITFSIE